MRKNRLLIILILLVLVGILGFLGYKRISTGKLVELSYTLGGKQLQEDEAYIMIDGEYDQKQRAKKIGDTYYLEFDIVKKIDSRFYYGEEGILLFTTNKKINKIEKNSKKLSDEINLTNPIYIEKDGKVFISLEALSQEGISSVVKFYKNPARIVAFNKLRFEKLKEVQNDVIRVSPWQKSPIIKKKVTEEVYQLEKPVEGYTKISTLDGYIGYVSDKKLSKEKGVITNNVVNDEHLLMNEKIMLGFNQVTSVKASETAIKLDGVSQGINIISPTWYSVKDEEGNITDISSQVYTTQMHFKGIRVWALIDDFSHDVNMLKLLKNSKARENLINNLVESAVKVDCDGINIDFEKINQDSAQHFIQFLRELIIKAHAHNLIISVDNYSPKEYNSFYKIDEQARIVDYIVIMSYDEHTTGPQAGSVSSYDFVKEGIEKALKSVDKKQIIVALPFYTRIWIEDGVLDNGESKFTSNIVAMNEQEELIKKLQGKPNWDKNYRQNYLEVRKDAKLNKIWLEDVKSLEEKVNIIKENDLGGLAVWKLGLETPDVWKVLIYK